LLRFRRNDLLDQRFEARIAAKGIEEWIYFDRTNIRPVPVCETLFEPAQRLVLVVQAK